MWVLLGRLRRTPEIPYRIEQSPPFGQPSKLRDHSPTLRTPPNRHLLPCHPLRAPLGQVLALRNQTLMNRTGQQGDAVPADLVAEVLTTKATYYLMKALIEEISNGKHLKTKGNQNSTTNNFQSTTKHCGHPPGKT